MQDSAAGAASKSLVLGRSYVKMGGFANMTTAEIQALTDSVAESAVVMTDPRASPAVDNFDASWRNIRDGFGKGLTLIGSFLIPLLSQLFDKMKVIAGVIQRDVVPEVKELWRVVGPVLIPVLKAFANVIIGNIKRSLDFLVGALKIVSGVLTGDFSKAWDGAKQVALGAMRGMVAVYNETIARLPACR